MSLFVSFLKAKHCLVSCLLSLLKRQYFFLFLFFASPIMGGGYCTYSFHYTAMIITSSLVVFKGVVINYGYTSLFHVGILVLPLKGWVSRGGRLLFALEILSLHMLKQGYFCCDALVFSTQI